MNLEIRDADGGYIVVAKDEDGSTEYVVTNVKDLLYLITELMGQSGGRYDADRIYIVEAPGDKHPDFNADHYDILFGEKDESE